MPDTLSGHSAQFLSPGKVTFSAKYIGFKAGLDFRNTLCHFF
jgi:hypothetical protein